MKSVFQFLCGSILFLFLASTGCDEGSGPVLPLAATGSIRVSISGQAELGIVDTAHPIYVFLFEDFWTDGRGDPLAIERLESISADVIFDRVLIGNYSLRAIHDINGDGIQQPSPIARFAEVVVESGTTVNLELLGLDDNIRSIHFGSQSAFPETPMVDREAEEMAFTLSGTLTAPQSLYQQVQNHLRMIRTVYGDRIPELKEIRFWPNGLTSNFIAWMNRDVVSQIRAGEFHALDELNESLGLAYMDTALFRWGYNIASLHFYGRLHPHRLIELYTATPSINFAELNGFGFERSNVYPGMQGNQITYLFRHAWGDCPSGCVYEEYWYFRCHDRQCGYMGYWNPMEEPEPAWWKEARENRRW